MSEFEIPKNNYLTFDAYTMKQYIRDRLNESDVFTDQNFEGSFLSSINNVVAYTFNSLMFYLNNTSSESMFSESQIYENMNRIVKMLSYKPIGYQTATLPFTPTVGTLTPGLYFIPRYSYFSKNNIAYSFAEDILFEKTTNGVEVLTDISNQKLLFQGRFREYSTQVAVGDENEIINLTTPETVNVDHFNINVYIKRNNTSTWEEWTQTENLYLELPSAQRFEVRLNEEKNYEIKFGNDINGSKLLQNDEVAIYYIESLGPDGEVGPQFLENAPFVLFNSAQFSLILNDISDDLGIQLTDPTIFSATNEYASTASKNIESVENIRDNAPGIFRSQLRLVTKEDFHNFIISNFSNFIHDVNVSNNWQFLNQRIQYLYNLGLENPLNDTNTLYAHAQFADACNFNNIYITACPKTSISSLNSSPILSNSQKQLIISTIASRKIMTSEVVILDPVYMAVNVGVTPSNNNPATSDISNSRLVIVKKTNSRRSDNNIKNDVVSVFQNEFVQSNRKLGDTINITELTNQILSIDGVDKIFTETIDTGVRTSGLRLMIYNPIYPQDVSMVTNNTDLLNFQFAFFEDLTNLFSKISVEGPIQIYENIEY